MRPTPAPETTATTPVTGDGSGRGGVLGVGHLLAHPPLLFDLLGQVGHPDLARPPGVEARFDGGPDVVGVDVAVPEAVPADHHDGVADPGPDFLEGGDGVVGRVEQVHDLVAQVARRRGRRRPCVSAQVGRAAGRPRAAGPRARVGRRATDSRASRTRRYPAPPASTTPGPGERLEHARASGPGRPPPPPGPPRPRPPGRRRQPSPPRRPAGGPGDGQDRALHRADHGVVGQVGRLGQRLGQVGRTRLDQGRQAVGHPPEQLGQDDPRVAPGPHERPVGHRLADVAQLGAVGFEALQLGHDRVQGEGHVRAGVAVGHGVDIEPVDDLLVGPQDVPDSHHRTRRRPLPPASTGPSMAEDANLCPVLGGSRASISAPVGLDKGRGLMAAVCELCGKKPSFGMSLSHSHRRNKRRWDPNIQRVRALVDGAPRRLHVCTSCIRAGQGHQAAVRRRAAG